MLCYRTRHRRSKEIVLARDNYKFAKRGREIAKKKKKEEKLQRKLEKNTPEAGEASESTQDDGPEETVSEA
jgi:hypothetical protein